MRDVERDALRRQAVKKIRELAPRYYLQVVEVQDGECLFTHQADPSWRLCVNVLEYPPEELVRQAMAVYIGDHGTILRKVR